MVGPSSGQTLQWPDLLVFGPSSFRPSSGRTCQGSDLPVIGTSSGQTFSWLDLPVVGPVKWRKSNLFFSLDFHLKKIFKFMETFHFMYHFFAFETDHSGFVPDEWHHNHWLWFPTCPQSSSLRPHSPCLQPKSSRGRTWPSRAGVTAMPLRDSAGASWSTAWILSTSSTLKAMEFFLARLLDQSWTSAVWLRTRASPNAVKSSLCDPKVTATS